MGLLGQRAGAYQIRFTVLSKEGLGLCTRGFPIEF